MGSVIVFNNGNTLEMDSFATDQFLSSIHKGELGNSLLIIHVADKSGRLQYTIPLNSVSHIEYKW